jgi:hypothetical protein
LVRLAQARFEDPFTHPNEVIAMSLLSLPPELVLLISSHLNSPKDLSSFLRTSQKFYHLLANELYQINIRSDGGSALCGTQVVGMNMESGKCCV